MSGQLQLFLSMGLIVFGVSCLIYSVKLTRDCQKIIKRMQRRSKKYIKAIDKSLADY